MINFFLPKFSDFFSANTNITITTRYFSIANIAITTRYKRDIMQKV